MPWNHMISAMNIQMKIRFGHEQKNDKFTKQNVNEHEQNEDAIETFLFSVWLPPQATDL